MNSTPSSRGRLASRRSRALAIASLVGASAIVVAIALSRPRAVDPAAAAAPRVPPVRQLELVHAEPFRTERPFRHVWRQEQPLVDRGWLLVLAGDPAQMVPRQTKEPVLFVGAQTADRVNTGQDSGRIVAIVPGEFRLEDAPIFYGQANRPEELQQRHIDAELAAARAAGAQAPTAEAIAKATAGVGQGRTFATDYQLRRRAIDLVEQYSPGEKDLIAGWRVPLVK